MALKFWGSPRPRPRLRRSILTRMRRAQSPPICSTLSTIQPCPHDGHPTQCKISQPLLNPPQLHPRHPRPQLGQTLPPLPDRHLHCVLRRPDHPHGTLGMDPISTPITSAHIKAMHIQKFVPFLLGQPIPYARVLKGKKKRTPQRTTMTILASSPV